MFTLNKKFLRLSCFHAENLKHGTDEGLSVRVPGLK